MEKFQKYFRHGAKSIAVIILILYPTQALSQLADTPWPMFMHDARHTGRSLYVGPEQPNIAWERTVSNNKPIIGKNGIIYTYYYKDGYMALRLDGTIADTGDVARVQVVTRDNTVYFRQDSILYALNADGSQKWRLFIGEETSLGNIVLDAQGDIFLDDGYNLFSIDPDGVLFWQIPLKLDESGPLPNRLVCHPAIGQNGTIYIVDYAGLKAFSQEGNLKWKFGIWPDSDCRNSISIGDDGTIYLGRHATFSSYPLLYAINPGGTKKWELNSDNLGIGSGRYGIFSPCAIGPDNTIYFGLSTGWNVDGYLCAVGVDGTVKWTYKAWKGFPGSPIVDAAGKVYAVSGNGDLYCFDSTGSLLWTYTIFHPYGAINNYSYPAIDSLGTLYVVAGEYSGGKLCAFFNINPAHTPDLSVIADSITFEPASGAAAAGTEVKINVPIKEIGGSQSAAFDVFFYADDFSHQIDSVRAYAPANFTTRIEGSWDTEGFKAKTYQIIIVVKNANPTESNNSNNQAQIAYQLLPSIQERIDLAQAGDTVWVAPGTYYENLTLKKGVVVKSTHGPRQTIIDGRRKDSVIKALHLDPTAVIEGFTLTNGYQTTFGGGGVYIERGGVTIRNNIICNNDATEGGAIWMIGSFVESDPIIENNLIIDNHASFEGGAVYANNSWALFRNNTVLNNSSSFSDKTGGIHAVGFWSSSPNIVNCIIWGNGINLGGTASAIYSCIEDSVSGIGNIFVDPMFVDPFNGNFSLQEGSPCIDAGDPTSPRDPDGTRADMGWKYYDQSATIARIMGRLTDATTGSPVTMAKIYLSGPRSDLVPPDAQGNYVFAVPADTGYSVSVFAPNHSSATKEHLHANIGEATVVDFSLTPYPTQITLFPPTDLKGSYEDGKVHLSWQRPMDELAFDDGYYEASVGFLNSQGILASGPFKPTNYPAKIERIKVAFDGERAGDKIELMIYIDDSGTATKPASSMLVFTKSNIPIEVGGGFQEIDVSSEGLTLNNGNFFIGIKQVNTEPMYMLLDQSSPDGHGFVDDDLDGIFETLFSQNIHGALAIRTVVSMPSSGGELMMLKTLPGYLPLKQSSFDAYPAIIDTNNKQNVGLVKKLIVNDKNSTITVLEKNELTFVAKPPQSIQIYRSKTSPVEISETNKIATMTGSATSYDDMNLGSEPIYYYIVAAKYSTGEIATSNEINVIVTSVDKNISKQLPQHYEFAQNYPNPFNPTTTIRYQLPKDCHVTIKVFNALGQEVFTLIDEAKKAGYHSVNWDARGMSSGLYFYLIKAGKFEQVRKMMLLR